MDDRKVEPGSWRIVGLLFFFMLINFADKAVIGLAAVPIMDDLKLTPSQFGLVGSSFFLLFALSSVVVGFICNHVQTRWVLLVMGLVWALVQFPMVGPVGFGTLILCRVILGAGEGPAYPVALHAAYKWFPNELRTLPTAVISQGAGIGIMVALPLLNVIIVRYSWHWAFAALGVAGLLWTAAWALMGREGKLVQPVTAQTSGERIPYGRLLSCPTIIASWCAFFGAYWALSLSLSWQGAYFVKGLGFAQNAVGLLTAFTAGLGVILVLLLGWYSQKMMARGVSSRFARGCLGGGCVALGGIALIALPLIDNIPLKIVAGALGMSLPSIIYVISHAVVSEITPVSQRGALLAIGNAIGTMAGLLAPFVMGSMVQNADKPLDGFHGGFVICGIVMLIGGLIGMMFMRPERDARRLASAGAGGGPDGVGQNLSGMQGGAASGGRAGERHNMDVSAKQDSGVLTEAFRRQFELSRNVAPSSVAERINRLRRLRDAVAQNEDRLASAISHDFGNRSRTETTIAEILFVLSEIRHAQKHLAAWTAPKRVATQLQFWPARNRLIPQPIGVVGIIAPWNYPLQLTLAPAVAALAAGNRVMIKPSELVPGFSLLLREIMAAAFDGTEVYVADASEAAAKAFAALPFDHLVFTGSTRVGRLVAEAAGRNLTPVTLELGGKSPAIVDQSADLPQAAARIAYGKLLNAGQTCIAPDYVMIPSRSVDAFANDVHSRMIAMFGRYPNNQDYTSIISDRHYERLERIVDEAAARGARIVQTARPDDPAWKSQRKFPPTVICGATPDMAIMKEEIFGPVLPVMACDSSEEAIAYINSHDRPLALYWFGDDAATRDEVLSRTVAGGVTVNDCLFHFTQLNQPMGGVGASGFGAYHGEWGFRTLSKLKPVFYRSRFNRFADLYPPYGKRIARLQRMLRLMS